MDKNAIKKYAIWARRELIERVSQRALQYGISAEEPGAPNAESINGRMLSPTEKKQRQALIRQVSEKGFDQVMEEVAYTWFNRFAALRFMEVNGYLPSHIRVFTNDAGEFKPQILSEAIHLELDGLDMEKVYELEQGNQTEELYRYLLVVQCNALNSILPGMFQKLEDYTELLLPDYLLREGSVIEKMVTTIPEEDWTDQVQIIGWLYQYYNTELKDQVFADLKKNIKITKEKIPAATQLFTPDWIVHYMVENSLGRLWLEGHPNEELKSEWKYYLDEAEQEPEVQAQLEEIRKEYAALKPEEIRVIDPCMGSGHILCVLFDVLVQIYEDYGYTASEAVVSIIENNLWGLDIDERASQLAYFAVMMKARQYDRRFFNRKVQPHVYAIQESNNIDPQCIEYFVDGREELKSAMDTLVAELHDAKEYGSILNVTPVDFDELYTRFEEIQNEAVPSIYNYQILYQLLPLVQVAQGLAQKYHVVVTNPPYMATNNLVSDISVLLKNKFPISKTDLFAIFIERCHTMTVMNGYQTMITQQAWMFLASFEKLRMKIHSVNIVNMAHLGARAFEEIGGEVVQTTAFIMANTHIPNYKGIYCRLIEATSQQEKENLYLSQTCRYTANQKDFSKVPGSPVAYWAKPEILKLFNQERIGKYYLSRVGLMTTDNNTYLRFFWEVDYHSICFSAKNDDEAFSSKLKWFPHNKGGSFRKWAGNQDYVVDWENRGERIKHSAIIKYPYLKGNPNFVVHDDGFYFKENMSWSEVAMGNLAFRYYPYGFTFNVKGMSAFPIGEYSLYVALGFCNSIVASYLAHIINPSISFGSNSFSSLPFCISRFDFRHIETIAKECVNISQLEWDSFETSWNFVRHPMIPIFFDGPDYAYQIENYYHIWERECGKRFDQLKANEEELNRIFIDIYELQDELTPEVEDKDVTVRKADLQRDIKSFISYAVGCMFGRYSLSTPGDERGLVYAGGEWDLSKYPEAFLPDTDAIIPICDDEYFEDDIVGRFVDFVEVVYGKDTLEENLQFIADALGSKGATPREVIRNYFLNDFYKDHCKTYQKRPIYWLFDSGKKNGFKCLIYLHRYQPDTIARIRTDYVHEQQSRYRTAIEDLEQRIDQASTSERVKLKKRLTKVNAQAEELRLYEEKIHHLADQMISIDLDDGVKHNYAIFQDVLAKIR